MADIQAATYHGSVSYGGKQKGGSSSKHGVSDKRASGGGGKGADKPNFVCLSAFCKAACEGTATFGSKSACFVCGRDKGAALNPSWTMSVKNPANIDMLSAKVRAQWHGKGPAPSVSVRRGGQQVETQQANGGLAAPAGVSAGKDGSSVSSHGSQREVSLSGVSPPPPPPPPLKGLVSLPPLDPSTFLGDPTSKEAKDYPEPKEVVAKATQSDASHAQAAAADNLARARGVLALLSKEHDAEQYAMAENVLARRQEELEKLEKKVTSPKLTLSILRDARGTFETSAIQREAVRAAAAEKTNAAETAWIAAAEELIKQVQARMAEVRKLYGDHRQRHQDSHVAWNTHKDAVLAQFDAEIATAAGAAAENSVPGAVAPSALAAVSQPVEVDADMEFLMADTMVNSTAAANLSLEELPKLEHEPTSAVLQQMQVAWQWVSAYPSGLARLAMPRISYADLGLSIPLVKEMIGPTIWPMLFGDSAPEPTTPVAPVIFEIIAEALQRAHGTLKSHKEFLMAESNAKEAFAKHKDAAAARFVKGHTMLKKARAAGKATAKGDKGK